MNWKQNIYHANANVNLMVENVIPIKSGLMVVIDVSIKFQKNIMCAKKIIFEILLHVVMKMVNVQQILLTICWLGMMNL